MKRLLYALVILALLLPGATTPAQAITDGELDGDRHPQVVVLALYLDDNLTLSCSGTLLSPTVVVTAGHCTAYPVDGPYTMQVYTGSNILENPNSIDTVTWAAHPLYETAPFYLHDVGVVILEEPGVVLDSYAVLPEPNQLDALAKKRGKQDVTFTTVGYGIQEIRPTPIGPDGFRRVAYPKLNAINAPGRTGDYSMLLSNNHSTGGICYGDSGGPNFIGDSNVIGGVTSFINNDNCAGIGGVFRLDRQHVLDFVNDFLNNQ